VERVEAEAKAEAEPRVDEQEEEEPNTEHEEIGIVANDINHRFGLTKENRSKHSRSNE
jgi:hypothetical protein